MATLTEQPSRETPQINLISDDPPNSPHRNALHPYLDEERSDVYMFDDASAAIAAPPLLSPHHFQSKPSSSKPVYDFGLLSSSLEPIDEEIKIDNQSQVHLGGETKSTPLKHDQTTTTTHHGPSK